LLADL
jgi:phospholipase D1/2